MTLWSATQLVSIIRDKVQCSHTSSKASALTRNPVETIYHAARGVYPLDTIEVPAFDEVMTHIKDLRSIQNEAALFRQQHPASTVLPMTDLAFAYAQLPVQARGAASLGWPHLSEHDVTLGGEGKVSSDRFQASVHQQRQAAYLHTKYPARYVAESLWASVFHPVEHQDHQALRDHCRQALQQFEQDTHL